jgi:hypothetical protein
MRAPPIRDAVRGGASTGPNGARHRADRDARADGSEPAFDVHGALDFVVGRVREQAHAHPLRTLGVAAGVGYVLGRGVPSIVVRLGMVAMARLATDSLLSATFGATLGPGGDHRDDRDEDGEDAVADDAPDDAPDDASASEATPTGGPRRARGRQPAREGARSSADD